MGANIVNNMLEALAPAVVALIGGAARAKIVSNLATERMVTVRATWDKQALGADLEASTAFGTLSLVYSMDNILAAADGLHRAVQRTGPALHACGWADEIRVFCIISKHAMGADLRAAPAVDAPFRRPSWCRRRSSRCGR
jgi:hypothetical protein